MDIKNLKPLTEFTEGSKTSQVVYMKGNDSYMVLLFEAELDYNGAKYFDNEQDAEDFAEDWVIKE